MQNEKYIGDVLLQKTFTVDVLSHKVKKNDGELLQYYVTDHHEAIIPKEIWYLVKAEMARRHTVKHKNTVNQIKKGRYSSQYALTELLICGECGTAYRRVTWAKRGKKKVVWRCVNRLLNGKKYCKHSPSLEESVLQEAIIWAINQYIKDKEQLKRCIKESIKDARQFVPENNADGLDEKIRMMEQSIMDLSELLSLSSAELDYFDQKFAELENSLKSLYLKKQEAETVKKVGVNFDQLDEEIMVWIDHQEFDLTQYNDVLVRKLIREVKVLQQDKIEILFMDGEKLESLVRI